MYVELSSHVNLTGIDYFDPKLKKTPHFSGQYFKHCFRYMHMQGMKNMSHLIVGGIFNVLLLENQSTACWHGGQIRPVQTLLRDVQNWFWTVQNHVLVSLPLGFWPKGRTPSPQDIQGELWLKTRCKFKYIFFNQL